MPANKNPLVFLADIDQAIREIVSFLSDGMDFDGFIKDVKTFRAVERNIGIIGEAVSQILKIDPCFPIENARQIVDTRNCVIHGYSRISKKNIWTIIEDDLPKLQEQVKKILEEEDAK